MAYFDCNSSNTRASAQTPPFKFSPSNGSAAVAAETENHGSFASAKSGRRILAELAGNNINLEYSSPVMGLQQRFAGSAQISIFSSSEKSNSVQIRRSYGNPAYSASAERLLRWQVRKLLQQSSEEENMHSNPDKNGTDSYSLNAVFPQLHRSPTPFNSLLTTQPITSSCNQVAYCKSRFHPQHSNSQQRTSEASFPRSIAREITISESVRSGADNRVLQLSPLLTKAVDVTISSDVFLAKRALQFDTP